MGLRTSVSALSELRSSGAASATGWALVDTHDVALAVLEPRRLAHTRKGGNLAVPLGARHVLVDLKDDTLGDQVTHLFIDVVDVPLRDGVTRLARVLGLVEVEEGSASGLVPQRFPAILRDGSQTQLVGIVNTGSVEIGCGNIGF